MSSIANPKAVSTPDMSPAEHADYRGWLASYDSGRYGDEAPESELPDWQPEEEDERWWSEQLAHLERQTPQVGPLSMPGHLDRVESARRRLGLISAGLAERVAYGLAD